MSACIHSAAVGSVAVAVADTHCVVDDDEVVPSAFAAAVAALEQSSAVRTWQPFVFVALVALVAAAAARHHRSLVGSLKNFEAQIHQV